MAAYFAEWGNVRTDYTTSGKQGLGNWQPKTLNERGSEKQFAVFITPMHLRVRYSTNQRHSSKVCSANICFDMRSLRPRHTHDKQSRLGIDDSGQQEPFENLENKKDVLIAPMLGNTQQKWLAIPTLGEAGLRSTRRGLNAVVNRDRDGLIGRCPRDRQAEMLSRAF
jgi:hypothetical protein